MLGDNFIDISDISQAHMFVVPQMTEDGRVLSLPHPRTNENALFLFQNNQLHEIIKCQPDLGSWFVGEMVKSDGGLNISVPVDPLFVALPIFEAHASENFVQLSDILPDDMIILEELIESRVKSITEFKSAPGLSVYKFSPEKTLKWLQAKVDRLSKQFETFSIFSSMPESYMKASGEEQAQARARIIVGTLSEWLTETWFTKLKQQYQETENSNLVYMDPALLQRKRPNSFEKEFKEEKKKKPSVSNGVKALAKVNTKGMAKLSTFFTPKPKPQ